MNKKEELRAEMYRGRFYEYISENGYRFSQEELIEIIKNQSFAAYQLGYDDEIMARTIENLDEMNFFEDLNN